MKTSILYTSLIILSMLTSCKNNKNAEEKTDMGKAEAAPTEIYVDTIILNPQTFHQQLICNGRLKAIAKSELSFSNGGTVVAVHVHNGDMVQKGEVIAETDRQSLVLEEERAQRDLERARVELSDKLIGLGYDGMDDNVPADVMHRAKVTSGYFSSQYALELAQKRLQECSLKAPFSGRIADLTGNRFQRMDKVCTLINDSYFDVEFSVMEAELKNIQKGQHVMVSPFANDAIPASGEVVNINPTVSEKGLILVKARIKNDSDKLIDGMNVKVIIENEVYDSFVVPKDAVVERDGYHVAFIYKNGEAVWTYVDIAHSNLNSHSIRGCAVKETELHKGDVIITSGNQNLADGTKVKIIANSEE